ncbi:tripartite tricarboxylate transporter permease [Breznakiella homolactica]|uniref:Tripartite tricarboxylate transporter permease n=1 Tax=Breznakiella homolactica TaxID=2798577 RepID=A0A7T7XNH1_9SPIR|nr:tripartite tricarboxylate transporter permease [Breznakiella homolactica]QQO09571.1 tripartite tricarboxylate transporter permease [Breznakiella homolactica]
MNWDIFLQLLNPEVIGFSLFGTILGIIFSAIPGLNAAIGISLLLPVTYVLSPAAGVLMLGGIYMGGEYGGSITAILLNVPGAVENTATAWDGHPLALQGRSREALYLSIFASTFGGIVGVLCLVFFTPPLASISLKFGASEMLLVSLVGLSIVGSLAGKNIWKALFATALGLFIATIGTDSISGVRRMTFGIWPLSAGINLISMVMGFYCFGEMFKNIGQKKAATFEFKDIPIKRLTVLREMFAKWRVLIKSTVIGIFLGILPGIGGGTSNFVAYGEAKRSSKDPDSFGKGNIEGVIAAEASNNAVVGGACIPLLTLGIPGSLNAALVGAGLMMHGIIPGPDLFITRPDVAYVFMYGMIFVTIAMGLIGTFGIRFFNQILKVKMQYLIPLVLCFSIFGSFSINNSMFDVFVALIFGILGIVLRTFDIPLSPLMIGAVLSNLIELNYRRSVALAGSQGVSLPMFILGRPICLIVLGIFVLFVAVMVYSNIKKKKAAQAI